jgi:hypothetical protein
MPAGHSNTILVSDLLAKDGPHTRVADDFLVARCTGCHIALSHDPRYGEWGAYCPNCWVESHTA